MNLENLKKSLHERVIGAKEGQAALNLKLGMCRLNNLALKCSAAPKLNFQVIRACLFSPRALYAAQVCPVCALQRDLQSVTLSEWKINITGQGP